VFAPEEREVPSIWSDGLIHFRFDEMLGC
jgi:hypothetical protein